MTQEKHFTDLGIIGNDSVSASKQLALVPTNVKNQALQNIAAQLESDHVAVLQANNRDIDEGERQGLPPAILDRLLLTPERLEAIAHDLRIVIALPDPIGEQIDNRVLSNGLKVERRRVPIGVIGIIYESRPNVTVDLAALCLKSGNACILRGGKEAINTNAALVNLIRKAILQTDLPQNSVQFIANPDRALVEQMLSMNDCIDLLIPRGGAELVRYVASNATMPAVTGGIGVCHTYLDRTADKQKALEIVFNAKVQRPSVCNALDTLLIHKDIGESMLPQLAKNLLEAQVELRCDPQSYTILSQISDPKILTANSTDWGFEFLDLILSIKIVDSFEEALHHIEAYGSGHSEAIVTEDHGIAERFANEVDSAAIFVNTSTRFNDGGQLGLGMEAAISTNKLHARGPMGLRELTSYKWLVIGNGQIRD